MEGTRRKQKKLSLHRPRFPMLLQNAAFALALALTHLLPLYSCLSLLARPPRDAIKSFAFCFEHAKKKTTFF
jgi:hypothetical protein